MAGSVIIVCAILLLAGCATYPPLNVIDCDPKYRGDCWAITHDDLQWLFDRADELEQAREALNECQKRL